MDFLEVVDAGRIFPRMFMILLGILIWDCVQWFQDLKEPNTQQSAFIGLITGIIPAVFAFYVNTGKKWVKHDSDSNPS